MLRCNLEAAGQGHNALSCLPQRRSRLVQTGALRCRARGRARRQHPCRASSAAHAQRRPPLPSMKRANDIRITSPNVDLDRLPDYLRKDCILFYCKEAEPLARKVAAVSDKVELGDVNWQCAFRPPLLICCGLTRPPLMPPVASEIITRLVTLYEHERCLQNEPARCRHNRYSYLHLAQVFHDCCDVEASVLSTAVGPV